jgi:hypothetical protein
LSDVKLPTVAALTAATVFALSPFYNNLVWCRRWTGGQSKS